LETSPQTPTLFGYYNLYRTVIGILLFGMTFSQQSLLAEYRDANSFQLVALGYLLINIALLVVFRISRAVSPKQVFSSATLDILVLHVLFYYGNGITGGLSNLLIISVATANIMIRGNIGLSFAAFASLLSISLEIERFLVSFSAVSDIARAGLLGSIYFATAFIVQNLTRRIDQSESLALQQKQDILELEKLNHQIIQSMRTGIIVCDEHFNIKMLNNACLDLITLTQGDALPGFLRDRITLWKNNPAFRTTPFRASEDSPMVQANFSRLNKDTGTETLIFIDDTRRMTQQAQQLKLASLGRLTASIAHEVRNPLGAISHATQLLAESEHLEPADRKMTDIIQRHCKRVNLIIENTLNLSRRDEPETQEVKLVRWLEDIISEYKQHQKGDTKIALEINHTEVLARFDPDQIEQVLVNLMDNGIRHAEKKNKASTLKIRTDQTLKGEQAFIDVIDEGDGVPEENLPHLFEPFFTTETQGTGLGLYLSKEICEANQAQLDYIDDHSGGACFRIKFAHPKRVI